MSGEEDASGLKKVLVWYGTPALKKISKRLGRGGRSFFFLKYQSIGLNYSSSLIIDRSPLPARPPRARVERRESALY